MNAFKPKLAITMGDAAGVGPELALRVWQHPHVQARCIPILFGNASVYQRVASQLRMSIPQIQSLGDLQNSNILGDGAIVDCGQLDANQVIPGRFSKDTGLASYQTVCEAIDATIRNQVDAMVTGPIQKEAWSLASIPFPGHTELLASRTSEQVGQTDPADVRMMLASDTIACVLETIHVPLADVPKLLNTESLSRTIRLAGETLQRRLHRRGSTRSPRIGVCGLNPHAGEHGLFSYHEEERIVIPAINAARSDGWDVIGPLPPDTAFTPAMREKIDVYVCLYHDQGLIPLKALSFDDAVNVTLGLPIVRTSVDHGTAMDLAWKGTASSTSLVAAIQLAAELVSKP
ncbi:4-hydroxythreonine-4-phosphate dehydrogenase [Neorhodopirellula lusitana]|uniref:4-hydroxythreonine-4-phosphate dehydrogenase n=1 Tax=Neorhodopirellula lusitana TaxID=445327 RepID=A0ABY1QPC0_9BACT|nr:4-hydroxythreonine-4-phosphate dehydrogenase PdxA [Neorhodopirellula lusitana]SMP76616.1 4-hydroxythreonine-4-phosphate dehydrogenase [Neorhodopirellula lusitana]